VAKAEQWNLRLASISKSPIHMASRWVTIHDNALCNSWNDGLNVELVVSWVVSVQSLANIHIEHMLCETNLGTVSLTMIMQCSSNISQHISLCRYRAAVAGLLLQGRCCMAVVAGLILQGCCCRAVVAGLLLQGYCCRAVVAGLLLHACQGHLIC